MDAESHELPEINPSQGHLLEEASVTSYVVEETFPADPKERLLGHRDTPIVYGPRGSYVDIIDRATHLDVALGAFGKRNQRIGFDVASNVADYDAPIYARYRGGVPFVRAGTRNTAAGFHDDARRSFWQATGFSAMRGTRLMPRKAIDARARKMWRDFSAEYGSPLRREERDTYRTRLKKSVRLSQKIIEQAASEDQLF